MDAAGWAGLPPALSALVEAELGAGNRVVAIDPGFPAPPVGFCVLLERDVSTRPAEADDGLSYQQWPNWKGYHGYTDGRGHFFVLNPPLPPEPDPPGRRVEWVSPHGASTTGQVVERLASLPVAGVAALPPADQSPLERFRQSMDISYEAWREGIGYDLDALDTLDESARQEAERWLISRGARDWRDVEALARLGTAASLRVLGTALEEGEAPVRLAVLQAMPTLSTPSQRASILADVLATAAPFAGLSQAIDQVAAYHPPRVVEALWRELARRDGEVAVHYAALLTYLHGRADSVFDFSQRPFFLSFNTADPAERGRAVAALRARLAGTRVIP